MKFSKLKPDTEREIIILCEDHNNNKYMIQGTYYHSESDYYNYDGDLLENVIAWADMPTIEYI